MPPGLSVFLGPNEAGKTTLLAFIRQMLFGFPDEQDGERHYPPLRGGCHGGRLYLVGPDGEYVVERSAALGRRVRVTLPDGRLGGEAELARLLGPCDRRLFQTVFAFSLSALQDFATLDAEAIQERIFSAGITGAGRSAREAVARLWARQAELLAPDGGGRITELRARLAEVEQRLIAARRDAAGYAAALRAEQAHAAEVARLTDEIEARRAEQARYRTLAELWPIEYRRREAQRELAGLAPVEAIPERAELRLAELQAALDAAERQVADLQSEVEAAEARRAALVPDDALAAVGEAARQLAETLPLYRDRIVALPAATARCRQALQTLDDHLRDLGPDWDRARLAAFDRSLPKREEVRAFAVDLARAEDARARAEAVARHTAEQQAQAAETLAALRQELAALPAAPAPDALERLDAAVRRLRASVAERASIEARIRLAEETLAQVESLRQRAAPPAPARSRRWLTLGLWGVAVLLGALAVAVWDSALAPPIALAAVLVAIGALLVDRRAPLAADLDEPVQQTFDAQQQRIQGDLAAYQARLREVDAAIQADAAQLELETAPDAAAVEAAAERVARLRAAYEQRLRKTLDVEAAAARLREAEAAAERARQAVDAAARDCQRRREAWDAWTRQAGLPPGLSPQGVLDFFESIRLGREALRAVEAAERAARQLSQFILAYERRAAEVLTAAGLAGDARGLELAAAIERLRERVERDREVRRARAALDDELRRLRARLDAARRERDALRERRAALLAEAGVADEASFHHRLATYRRRQELADIVRACDQRLAEALGEGREAAALRAELASGELERWRRAAEEAGQAMLRATEARDRAIAARREAELARRQLEESTAIADLELERAALLDEYAAAVRAWQVAGLAAALIQETLARYERERQPAVLAAASRLFHDVTGGAYTRLLQHEQRLVVLDRDGRPRPLDTLSRGTAEQLYLCIRLGLAAEFARRAVALPLVMDDILVNFDPERARVVAGALAAVAEQQQVLLFTCHPETAELIRAVAPASGRYVMSRFGGEIRAAPAELPAS
ncbi:MAG: AAA family ATPase [Acetobacteraceae bacterium]|nr:AAA family ATPase [Acetobacteraceae bacterium]